MKVLTRLACFVVVIAVGVNYSRRKSRANPWERDDPCWRRGAIRHRNRTTNGNRPEAIYHDNNDEPIFC